MRQIFKVLVSLAVLAAMCGCDRGQEQVEDVPVIPGRITLTATSEQMRSDGLDMVEFTVSVTDSEGAVHDVTEYAEIYLDLQKTPLQSPVFSTDKDGDYLFYAVYGLSLSNELVITAFNDLPELPADPQEDNVSFSHRMLLIQHTGATCVNCPRMMESLKKLSEDEDYSSLYHHVASHSYNGGEADDAYSEAARNVSMAYNTSGLYPMLTYNLTTVATGTDLSEIKAQIDAFRKDRADVGIAASAKVSGNDVLVNVEVKAARENDYRVAAWLLEDGIYSLQAGMSESWHNTHDNALRYAAGAVSQFSFVGEKLGRLSESEKAGKVFSIPMDDAWKAENCEVLVFVTSADENGNYDIANCVLCPVGEAVTYDYL